MPKFLNQIQFRSSSGDDWYAAGAPTEINVSEALAGKVDTTEVQYSAAGGGNKIVIRDGESYVDVRVRDPQYGNEPASKTYVDNGLDDKADKSSLSNLVSWDSVNQQAVSNTIVQRTQDGAVDIRVPFTPTYGNEPASKDYVDQAAAKKLDKVTTTSTRNRLYMIAPDGTQTTTELSSSNVTGYSIPYRKQDGNIAVPEAPTQNNDAASKKYVDDGLTDKQDTINENNKLSADYLQDGNTNKVFTAIEQTKLAGIESGAQVNTVDSVNGHIGAVSLSYNDLSNIPIINQDLNDSGFTPVVTTYYKHIGETNSTFINGVIYYNSGVGFYKVGIRIQNDLLGGDPAAALSASQGYILNQKINAHTTVKVFDNISTMISTINTWISGELAVGYGIYIKTLEVPDLWVSGTGSYSPYVYTTDEDFVNDIAANGSVQVGLWELSVLETNKVDLTNYVKDTREVAGYPLSNDVSVSDLDGALGVSNKVAKQTFPTGVTGLEAVIYAVSNDNEQITLNTSSTIITQGYIPRYSNAGKLISNSPSSSDNGDVVANKQYVDNIVNSVKIRQIVYNQSIFAATTDSDTNNLGKINDNGLIDVLFSGHVTKILSVLLSIDGTTYPCSYYSNGVVGQPTTSYYITRLDTTSGVFTLGALSQAHGITLVVNYYD